WPTGAKHSNVLQAIAGKGQTMLGSARASCINGSAWRRVSQRLSAEKKHPIICDKINPVLDFVENPFWIVWILRFLSSKSADAILAAPGHPVARVLRGPCDRLSVRFRWGFS